MTIRTYQPGDEQAQADIYNAVAGSLPGFKPANAAEITRRYQGAGPDSGSRYYAVDNSQVVGYVVFSANGRISAPWCLPGAEACREPLFETVLTAMHALGIHEAWAAYRGDWSPVLDLLDQHGFVDKRTMINFVADISRLPAPANLPPNRQIEPLRPDDLPHVVALDPSLFADMSTQELEQFYWHNPFYNFRDSLFALRDREDDKVVGAFVLVKSDRFADPTKIDAAMPCFRLGAFGTERERHKRVNGLFSCVFAEEAQGDLLLSQALASLAQLPSLTHIAAQAPSDAISLCRWYDRLFERQGSFPILSRPLAS
jgi:hypothetical protein